MADWGRCGRGRVAARCVSMTDRSHRRFNPLRGEWVIVSAGRNARHWQGRIETPDQAQPPEYDANCYLCPGNERAHGGRNPRYASTFAFDNDFPALMSEQLAASPRSAEAFALQQLAPSPQPPAPKDLLTARPEHGLCRVLCFSPRHDLTLSRMET